MYSYVAFKEFLKHQKQSVVTSRPIIRGWHYPNKIIKLFGILLCFILFVFVCVCTTFRMVYISVFLCGDRLLLSLILNK